MSTNQADEAESGDPIDVAASSEGALLSGDSGVGDSGVVHDAWSAILYTSMGLDPREAGVTSTILKAVARDIVEGRIGLGQEVNSVELARRFGTSRTPVREALLRLEAGGLVTVPPRQRPSVWNPTATQARHIYELRAHLDALVSELVVRGATHAQLARLAYWQRLREDDGTRGDATSYFWHNVAGRNEEASIAGNGELERVITQLGLRALVLRHISLSIPGRISESALLHRRLLEAYQTRDEHSAATLSRLITMEGYRAISRLGVLPTHS
jgi:DNA-binding GntR family transcriptional regulator